MSPDEVIIGGNASLNLMYDTVAQVMTHGTSGGGKPWFGQKIKFLCPVPGYDRHFAICEHFGIEMIPVPLNDGGPDMDGGGGAGAGGPRGSRGCGAYPSTATLREWCTPTKQWSVWPR